jgi:hypothetical protein
MNVLTVDYVYQVIHIVWGSETSTSRERWGSEFGSKLSNSLVTNTTFEQLETLTLISEISRTVEQSWGIGGRSNTFSNRLNSNQGQRMAQEFL